jgi:hypothetical protein
MYKKLDRTDLATYSCTFEMKNDKEEEVSKWESQLQEHNA